MLISGPEPAATRRFQRQPRSRCRHQRFARIDRRTVEQYTPSRAGIAAQHAGRGSAQAIGHERHRHRFVSEQIDLEAMSMP